MTVFTLAFTAPHGWLPDARIVFPREVPYPETRRCVTPKSWSRRIRGATLMSILGIVWAEARSWIAENQSWMM